MSASPLAQSPLYNGRNAKGADHCRGMSLHETASRLWETTQLDPPDLKYSGRRCSEEGREGQTAAALWN